MPPTKATRCLFMRWLLMTPSTNMLQVHDEDLNRQGRLTRTRAEPEAANTTSGDSWQRTNTRVEVPRVTLVCLITGYAPYRPSAPTAHSGAYREVGHATPPPQMRCRISSI